MDAAAVVVTRKEEVDARVLFIDAFTDVADVVLVKNSRFLARSKANDIRRCFFPFCSAVLIFEGFSAKRDASAVIVAVMRIFRCDLVKYNLSLSKWMFIFVVELIIYYLFYFLFV